MPRSHLISLSASTVLACWRRQAVSDISIWKEWIWGIVYPMLAKIRAEWKVRRRQSKRLDGTQMRCGQLLLAELLYLLLLCKFRRLPHEKIWESERKKYSKQETRRHSWLNKFQVSLGTRCWIWVNSSSKRKGPSALSRYLPLDWHLQGLALTWCYLSLWSGNTFLTWTQWIISLHLDHLPLPHSPLS